MALLPLLCNSAWSSSFLASTLVKYMADKKATPGKTIFWERTTKTKRSHLPNLKDAEESTVIVRMTTGAL